MLEIDHVIFAVEDFDTAADRLKQEHGLASVAGGRHPGHGTGNRIVPLGANYIELMSVVDEAEAAASPLGRWVQRRAAAGGGPAALCLRTDNIEVVAARLGLEPLGMSRAKPDGTALSWHLAGLERMLADGFPFFIEWHADAADLPGRMPVPHDVATEGICWVEVGGDAKVIGEWLGGSDVAVNAVPGGKGVVRLGVDVGGEVRIF
jgi:hypothetical protein